MKTAFSLPPVVLLAVFVVGCGGEQEVKHANTVMGTFAQVTAVAPTREEARAAVNAAYARFDDVNRLMSDYVDDSEIGRINRAGAGQPTPVSEETFACVERALQVCEASGGAFDVTCRPLVRLWKTCAKEGRTPTDDELARTRAVVSWRLVSLDAEKRAVSFTAEGVQLDLGGVAKGYSLDLAAERMKQVGATKALIDVGGDVLTVGTRRDGKPWVVGLKHPFQPGVFRKLALVDRAVATSGVQQRFYDIDGHRYSHIVDPRSGQPAEQAPCVTVIAPDGLTADAWATAFSVLSVDEARVLAETLPDVEACWITGDAEKPIITQTAGFQQYVVE